jgi:hypothetical protein
MDLYSSQKAQWIVRILLFTGLVFIVIFHLCLPMPGVDAGIQMYGGLLVSKGFEPHRHLVNNKPTLIYFIGAAGFFLKSNPFLGIRIIELVIFIVNLFLIRRIAKAAGLKQPVIYQLTFCAIYLVCWDEGFLPETFNIPLVLLTVYFFLRRMRGFEFFAALMLVLSFLLKQNAFAVIGGVILIDIFSWYRRHFVLYKIARYLAALVIYFFAWYGIMKSAGAWDEFLYQAFTYNAVYAERPSLWTAIVNHIRHNSFLSVKGVSVVMIFNAFLLITLWKKYRQYIALSFEDRVMISAILIYTGAYFFTYLSGKSHPHYFMLLIVPATFILGRYVRMSLVAELALLILLTYGIYTNMQALSFNRQQYELSKAVTDFLKKKTSPEERIHVVGMGNQYMYVMADRLSSSRFIVPYLEDHGYEEFDKELLTRDFTKLLPKYIVTNKNERKLSGSTNFYFQVVQQALQNYQPAFQNDRFIVYQRNANLATH